MRFDLTDLSLFRHVVEAGSITHGAERAHLALAAASTRIRNMELALKRTYDATPDPKLVVAVGDCGCTGGVFGESYASAGRVANVIPVDVAVPGCPPTPERLLAAILTAISPARP